MSCIFMFIHPTTGISAAALLTETSPSRSSSTESASLNAFFTLKEVISYDFDGSKFGNIFSLKQTARSVSLELWLQRLIENILPFFVERNSLLFTTAQVRFSAIF